MRIEAARQAVADLPMTTRVQARLRETARLRSTHYSTQIEGNRLTLDEATRVIRNDEHVRGRQRDEKEVLGYYRALDALEDFVVTEVTQQNVQTLHALVMAGRKGRVKPTPYRDGQNVIRDSRSGAIVYLPPEAKDVPLLVTDLVRWLSKSARTDLPCPLQAAIAHYQFATIHPYYDGNGRTARLLTTLVLHRGGYDLKGFYSLEEYYARNLFAYYEAIAVGPSHNYYLGRAEADITRWLEYFTTGMAEAFESVQREARREADSGRADASLGLRKLDVRQRRVVDLFRESEWITSADVATALNLTGRTARHLCQQWADEGFIVVVDPSKKARKYGAGKTIAKLIA